MSYVDMGSKFTLLCIMGITCWKIKTEIGAEQFKPLEPQLKQTHFYNTGHIESHRKRQYLPKMYSETNNKKIVLAKKWHATKVSHQLPQGGELVLRRNTDEMDFYSFFFLRVE